MARGKGDIDWPKATKDEAVKLCIEAGGKASAAHRELARRYPDQKIPKTELIRLWAKKYEAAGHFKRLTNWDVMDAWGEVEKAALTELLHEIQMNKIGGQSLAIVAGISADKRLKFQEIQKGKVPGQVNIYNMIAERRQELLNEGATVEGEIVEVPAELLPAKDNGSKSH